MVRATPIAIATPPPPLQIILLKNFSFYLCFIWQNQIIWEAESTTPGHCLDQKSLGLRAGWRNSAGQRFEVRVANWGRNTLLFLCCCFVSVVLALFIFICKEGYISLTYERNTSLGGNFCGPYISKMHSTYVNFSPHFLNPQILRIQMSWNQEGK